jgi:hypothetical protein
LRQRYDESVWTRCGIDDAKKKMADYDVIIEDLVAANRILAAQEIVDAFGHVSAGHPQKPDRFLLSRAKSPELVEADDIMEFILDGVAIDSRERKGYLERFIHGGLYEARPDIQSVVHSHSRSAIPFGLTQERLRPVVHSSWIMGCEVPVWGSCVENVGDIGRMGRPTVTGLLRCRTPTHWAS